MCSFLNIWNAENLFFQLGTIHKVRQHFLEGGGGKGGVKNWGNSDDGEV